MVHFGSRKNYCSVTITFDFRAFFAMFPLIIAVMAKLFISHILVVLLLLIAATSQMKDAASSAQTALERGANLAESGHCTEALPLLRKAIRQAADKEQQRRAG